MTRVFPISGVIGPFPRSATGENDLRQDTEWHVARQGAAGCDHLDFAGGRAVGHRGGDQGWPGHFEHGRRAVERHAGGGGQFGTQDFDGGAYFGEGRQTLHEGADPQREAEDRTARLGVSWGAAEYGGAVKAAVGGLDQPGVRQLTIGAVRQRAEAVKSREGAAWGDLESGPIALDGRAIAFDSVWNVVP